jgi:hypothetical protein
MINLSLFYSNQWDITTKVKTEFKYYIESFSLV